MNNFETKKKYFSEEIVVRDVVVAFLLQEYEYSLERKAISLKGGVLFVAAQPLIKKRLLQDGRRLCEHLATKGITILAIR